MRKRSTPTSGSARVDAALVEADEAHGEELLHPLTERWRAEGASDSEEGAEAEQGPADTEAESNSDDDSGLQLDSSWTSINLFNYCN